MYIPDAFRVTDESTIFDFVERHSFALLTTQHHGEPLVSHLPLLLDRDAGPHGTLVGHWARANPQWQSPAGQTALAVFVGPHAYVSPRWYAEPNVVPTWNYATVHAYGRLEIIDDAEALKRMVHRFVEHYEAAMPEPWQLPDASPLVDGLVKQIVGFHFVVDRWEAKFKLNQNHSPVRRERVRQALADRPDAESQAVAELMGRMNNQFPG